MSRLARLKLEIVLIGIWSQTVFGNGTEVIAGSDVFFLRYVDHMHENDVGIRAMMNSQLYLNENNTQGSYSSF